MNVSHTYTANGQYNVVLVIDGVCGTDTITQLVTIQGIGIDESLISQTLNIYPNPNDGKFRVEFQLEGLKEVSVRITDVIGKEIYFNELGNVSGQIQETINVSGNADGIYILQIISNGVSVNRRITLQ